MSDLPPATSLPEAPPDTDTGSATPVPSTQQRRQLLRLRRQAAEEAQGVPLWLPLAALIIAFVFALFIAIRIGPTLSALVSPPDPVLPPDSVLQSHESNGTEDQWLYTTKTSGCRVARMYATAYGACKYDPSSGCGSSDQTDSGGSGVPSGGNSIAECAGSQVIADNHITWHIYISANGDKDKPVIFRVYRDLG